MNPLKIVENFYKLLLLGSLPHGRLPKISPISASFWMMNFAEENLRGHIWIQGIGFLKSIVMRVLDLQKSFVIINAIFDYDLYNIFNSTGRTRGVQIQFNLNTVSSR